jgi:crotonobetainyl-CoA:carnitine CoA-transferase CaiB-like acyl-CoA transferase
VSICDITAGMNALIGIQQALLQRERTGVGSRVEVSLFDSAADLMAVPYLQARYGAGAPERVGLKHPSIAPYGAFTCSDEREIVLSIQNEREWGQFCQSFLNQADLATDARFNNNANRVRNRQELDGLIQKMFSQLSYADAIERLNHGQTAFGSINSVSDLIAHPQLRTRSMTIRGQTAEVPAPPYVLEWEDKTFKTIPDIGANAIPDRH